MAACLRILWLLWFVFGVPSLPKASKCLTKIVSTVLTQVATALPQLTGYSAQKVVRSRLSSALTYRRNHINNTKYWKRSKKLQKYGKTQLTRARKPVDKHPKATEVPTIKSTATVVKEKLTTTTSETNNNRASSDDEEDDGFSFSSGEEVWVQDGAAKLARAAFLRVSVKDSDNAKLSMLSNYCTDSSSPPKCPDSKIKLNEVKAGEKFYWPLNQLLIKTTPAKPKKAKVCVTVPTSTALDKQTTSNGQQHNEDDPDAHDVPLPVAASGCNHKVTKNGPKKSNIEVNKKSPKTTEKCNKKSKEKSKDTSARAKGKREIQNNVIPIDSDIDIESWPVLDPLPPSYRPKSSGQPATAADGAASNFKAKKKRSVGWVYVPEAEFQASRIPDPLDAPLTIDGEKNPRKRKPTQLFDI